MFKFITIIGARPQFIKAAAVSRALREYPEIQEVIVHTGQHFDANMSDIFFDEMDIPKPKYNLDIHGVGHGAMTGRMLEGIEAIILKENPDWLLIYGDTNSTLAGALAASKLNIKIAHIEAGLRSFNMKMPEEINRILADRVSTILFCPTTTAVKNLHNEGYEHFNSKIVLSGDVMLDAARFYEKNCSDKARIASTINFPRFILSTIHRAENTDDVNRLSNIVEALNKLHEIIPVVLPLHPRTTKKIKDLKLDLKVHVIEPVGYFDMISFLSRCELVITDSGGLQKEAYFFEKPCVTFRDETEWVELVEVGANKVIGSSTENIISAADFFLKNKPRFEQKLYGDGSASHIIIKSLLEYSP